MGFLSLNGDRSTAAKSRMVAAGSFTPRSISGLALWLDASSADTLYTTDAGPVTAVREPTEISGCVLWLDGADSATITSSGGFVSQWTDKSASGAVLQASGSARPTLSSTGFNGRQALVFNGTSTHLASVSSYTATNGLSGLTRIAVCQNVSGNGVVARVYNGGSDMFVNMNGSWRSAIDATSGTNFVSSTTFSSGSALPAGIYSDVFASSAFTQYGLGTVAALTINGTIPSTTGTGTPALHVGSNTGANFWWNGPIAEVIYFNRALTRAELARVEAYLAAKWGITGVHAPATATSDPVGAWLDKSGNARHATQSTAGNRPVIHSATQNNRKILSFDGSNDALLGTGAQALKTGMTVIGAYFAGNVNYASLFCVGDTAAGKRWLSGSSLSKVGIDYYTNALSVQADSRNRTGITSFTLNPSANSLGIRMDGAQVLSQASLSPALAAYTSDTFAVGSVPLANEQWMAGRIFELAVYNRVLSAAECRRVEQALATKWGLTLAPQVSNADAQDWINRVYANGGSVSSSTAAAVNTFCDAIDAASLRDRFYRLNLFCGGTSGTAVGLNSALVPLYRGPSLGGTQYGNTTDTNTGGLFVVGDYSETLGLLGGGSRWLNTGFTPQSASIPAGSVHLSAVWPSFTHGASTNVFPVSMINAAATERHWLNVNSNTLPTTEITATLGGNGASGNIVDTLSAINGGVVIAGGLRTVSRTTSSLARLFLGATQRAQNTDPMFNTLSTESLSVFARWSGSTTFGHFAQRMMGYSAGLGMDSAQVSAFNTAITNFNAAMERSI